VTDLLISEFGGPAKPGPDAFDRLVVERGLKPVTFDDWLVIKELEERAATDPAPRRKFATVEEMLDGLGVA
jgi:hypothetical protein